MMTCAYRTHGVKTRAKTKGGIYLALRQVTPALASLLVQVVLEHFVGDHHLHDFTHKTQTSFKI